MYWSVSAVCSARHYRFGLEGYQDFAPLVLPLLITCCYCRRMSFLLILSANSSQFWKITTWICRHIYICTLHVFNTLIVTWNPISSRVHWWCLLEGDHFYPPFYHLSQSQKCYGILMLIYLLPDNVLKTANMGLLGPYKEGLTPQKFVPGGCN